MAQKVREDLKKQFEAGDKLTSTAFTDLIDSLVSTQEDSNISGSLMPTKGSTFNLGSAERPWKELFVSKESIKLVDTDTNTTESLSKADVTDLKNIESQRKSTDGIPVKRIRSFTSSSTFIDLEASHSSAGDRIDIKVANTFEALSISTARVSLGPKESVPLELTGSLKIRPSNNEKHEFHGKYQFSGQHASGSDALSYDEELTAVEISGSFLQSSSGGIVTFGTLGTSFVGGNVVMEDVITSQPGVINQSINIGTSTSPSIAEYIGVDVNHRITLAPGVVVNVHPGSKMIVKPQQPNILADNETGDITVTSPGGATDITFNVGSFGSNPKYVGNNINIPMGNSAGWYGPIHIGKKVVPNDSNIYITNLGSIRINEEAKLRIKDF